VSVSMILIRHHLEASWLPRTNLVSQRALSNSGAPSLECPHSELTDNVRRNAVWQARPSLGRHTCTRCPPVRSPRLHERLVTAIVV
jgi:hypothetical protein